VFAHPEWNSAGNYGLAFAKSKLFLEQCLAVGVSAGYAIVVTFVILEVVDKVMGLRVAPEAEFESVPVSKPAEAI